MPRSFRRELDGPLDPPKVSPRRARMLLGRLFALSRPEWPRLALALVMLALGSAGSIAFPQAIKAIIDGALAKTSNVRLIDRYALVMLGIFVVQAAASAGRFLLFSTAGERVVARLKKRIFERLLEQELAFFDERRTGDLTSSLATDTTVLQSAVSVNLSMLLRNLAMVAGGVAMLFWTSVPLTLVMLAVVPAIALGAVSYGKRVRRLSRQAQDAAAEAAALAEESLSNVRTVRAFASERREVERYATAIDRGYDLASRRIATSSVFMGVAMTAGFGAVALVFWYGGRLVLGGALSAGALTSFLIYTLTVAFALAALADLWSDFMRAAGAAERVFELLDRSAAMQLEGGARLARVDGRVRFGGVVFRYPARPDVAVLSGVDLEIAPGEVVAVVGHSGAGKSTIAGLLSRFYDPNAGEVLLDGADLRDLDPSWLRRQIGIVSQEPILFSSSIADNIRYAKPDATDAEVEAAARTANAHDFIVKFPDGYATKVGERGVQLSGGQKQRVAIARAILKDPRVLVLDEATSALDAESEHLVREALDRLQKGGASGRRTTLVIAHRLSTIADADRVVVLDGGRIAQTGTHQRLMREEGLYKRLVERQHFLARAG
jgi:ATP-binding cassette subfamily B protein